MGIVGRLFAASYPLRLVFTLSMFLSCLPLSILFTTFNSMDGMLGLWKYFCFVTGFTMRVHGPKPPLDEPALWVANH